MFFYRFYSEQSSAAADKDPQKNWFFFFLFNRKLAEESFNVSIDDEILFLFHEEYATLQQIFSLTSRLHSLFPFNSRFLQYIRFLLHLLQ